MNEREEFYKTGAKFDLQMLSQALHQIAAIERKREEEHNRRMEKLAEANDLLNQMKF